MGTNITGIGNANAIGFKSRVTGGIYFPPELKDALVGVWSAYGKSNDSTDRNIIKNKIKDRGGDFVISNAAFKLNSGFGGFVEDFTSWDRIDSSTAEISNDGSKIKCINTTLNVQYLFNYINRDISSFKVKISNFTKGDITYYYRKEDGIEAFFKITPLSVVNSDKVIELPKSYNTVENGTGSRGGFYSSNINIGVTIEQIPSFEGAFVTDGINDLITSTKTASEMGITNEVTVVSMIHQIRTNSSSINRNNFFCNKGLFWFSNNVINSGKTGIYGYTSINNSVNNIINNILGDKNDYSAVGDKNDITPSQFSVVGYIGGSTGEISYTSSVAWYWTIIANKVLTTDQINQVIAYFNLDRTLKPDILCDVKKQGITNENHAEFGDKLIDFSGNGRDIQLNNLAWKLDSGIGKYETDLSDTRIWTRSKEITSSPFSFSYNGLSGWILFANTKLTNSTDIPSFKIQIKGLLEGQELIYRYYDSNGQSNVYSMGKDGEYTLPSDVRTAKLQTSNTSGFQVVKNETNIITITQIPSHAGALCLDGVNDFGQFVGDLGLKDYTLIMNRAYNNLINNQVPLISSNIVEDRTPFIVEHWNTGSNAISFSYGASRTTDIPLDINKKIVYQSTYSYMGYVIPKGNAISTGNGITLGKFGNGVQYSAICLWSLMLFPYSMSEFLIERQLKKYKLGTLYPDMVEFRPVIKTNVDYTLIQFYINNYTKRIYPGDYIPINTPTEVNFYLKNNVNELISFKVNGNDSTFKRSTVIDNAYNIRTLPITKSPQKIDITIDEYIRFEDIVQPYPVLLRFKDENGNEVSWGGKFRVGSTITRIGSAADSNLLPNIYNIFGLLLNDNQVTSSKVIVEKTMVFKAKSTYIFDNNEPKCILSPRLLRIPNSSYKLLGYIPDISGHGNHGVIHNSAYAEGSGVNEDGSYQFDGVDDFVTIPTTVGGKQVLMKVNWQKSPTLLYDQRASGSFAVLTTKEDDAVNSRIAYQGRNQDGKTYIDGIENNNIETYTLKDITHNITIANSSSGSIIVPAIGCNTGTTSSFAQMSLYDFMLFDNISTDDKIKELNEYVGIEAKVELPPYYWDAYGKTNLDEDKATIQQRGVAVGDYDLTNYNHAYEGMSGYNGYPVVFGANKTWANESNGYVTSITSNTIHITNVLNAGLALLYSYVKYNGNLQNIKEIPSFKIEIKGLEGRSKFIYKYLATSDATKETNLYLGNGTHELPKSFLPTEALINNAVVGFSISPIEEGVTNFLSDITIEVLPEYENGLAYDGVSDFTDNKNIPILTDFTFIIKREILGLETNESMLVIKGDKVYNNGIGNAFILEHNSNGVNYVYSYGKLNWIKRDDSKIIYLTPESYNGNPIIKGENGDNLGLVLSRHWRGIIYKTILYSKTISLLHINFLKNLMEKDEIIDLNNPIFIKNE